MSITIEVSGDSASANIIYNSEGAEIKSNPSPFVENELTALINWALGKESLPKLLNNITLSSTPVVLSSNSLGTYYGNDLNASGNSVDPYKVEFKSDGSYMIYKDISNNGTYSIPYGGGMFSSISTNGIYEIAISKMETVEGINATDWLVDHINTYSPGAVISVGAWYYVWIFNTSSNTVKYTMIHENLEGNWSKLNTLYSSVAYDGYYQDPSNKREVVSKMDLTIPWTKTNPTAY